MQSMHWRAACAIGALVTLLPACSSDDAANETGGDAATAADSSSDSTTDSTTALDANPGRDSSPDGLLDAAPADTPDGDAAVEGGDAAIDTGIAGPIYAHTATELFLVRPNDTTLTPNDVGAFDCIGGSGQDAEMTDLAVDGIGNLWGLSASNVYSLSITGTAVHCASTVALTSQTGSLYGLSLAPVGVLDPTSEVLVAASTAGGLWAIDTSTGGLTQHGTLGDVPVNDGHGHTYSATNVGKAWELSGDIVLLANGGSPIGFATVRDCPNPPSATGCNAVDTLIEIDMSGLATAGTQNVTKAVRGMIVKGAGCTDPTATGYGSFYGIAAWEGDVLGFSHVGGAIVRIDNVDGSGCLVTSSLTSAWSGAGITTAAPVIPPPIN